MKKSILIAIIFSISHSVNGQIDSLLNLLSTSKLDTSRVILLNDIGKSFFHINPNKSLVHLTNAIGLSKSLKYNTGLTNSYKNKGTAFYYLGKLDSTKYYWTKSLNEIPENQVSNKGDAYNNLGVLLQRIGKLDSSLYFYQRALFFKEQLADSSATVNSISNIAAVYRKKGNYSKALEHYFSALKVYEKLMLPKETSNVLNGIGLVYMGMSQHKQSLSYLKKSHKVRLKLKNLRLIASSINNIATVNRLLKNYDDAEQNYIEFLDISQKLSDKRGIAGAYSNLGNISKIKGNSEQSVKYYLKAKLLFTEMQDVANLAVVSNYLGGLYLSLNKPNLVINHYNQALEYAKKSSSKENQKIALDGLSTAYELKKNFKLSLTYKKESTALKDSLFNKDLTEKTAFYQEKYESEKKARKIQELENEQIVKDEEVRRSKLMRNWAVALSVLFLFVLAMLFNHFKLKQKIHKQKEDILEKEKEEYKLMTELKEQEIKTKNQELSSIATNSVNKNRLFIKLSENITSLKKNPGNLNIIVSELENLIKNGLNLDEEWNTFLKHFNNVHSDFFTKLKNKFPQLTPNDLKNCAYIRMNLSSKEIAILMNITPKSAKMTRYRLKKKFNLTEKDDINNFILSI